METNTPKPVASAHTGKRSVHRAVKIAIIASVALAVLASGGVVFAKTALPLTATLSHKAERIAVGQPIKIQLNQSIRDINTSAIAITPAIQGAWTKHTGSLIAENFLSFTPADSFRADTAYTVSLPAADRLLAGKTEPQTLTFRTEPAPSLTNAGMNALKDGSTIAADYAFPAVLSSKNNHLRTLELRTTPKLTLKQISSDDTTYTWKVKELLPQGKKLTVELYDTKNDEQLLKRTYAVASMPRITSSTHQVDLTPDKPVDITFQKPMKEENDAISFDVKGDEKWLNTTTYRFTPTSIQPGKTYNYTSKEGLRSAEGGILTEKQTGTVTTRGAVAVVGSSPRGDRLKQDRQVITFTFNQPIDAASAKPKFSVNAGQVASVTVQGNTLAAVVTKLGYQQTITAHVAAGVKNAGFGLPSSQAASVSFTTEYQSKRLSVPHFQQQHSATCAVASTRMALAYYGIGVSEMSIVGKMGYKPTTLNKKTNPATWDDPREMFVGSVDGSITNGTGAGPDAPPVAKVAQSYGRSASVIYGATPSWIAQQIYNGDPVVMFGAYRHGLGFISWKTPSGRIAKMNRSSHATVVTGVVGSVSSPIGFWVSDPMKSSVEYWSAGSVAANIAQDADRQAVVIR